MPLLDEWYTHTPTDWLVWRWDIDWGWKDTSWQGNDVTLQNVSFVSSERWYVSEVWDFNWTNSKGEDNSFPWALTNAMSVSLWVNFDSFPTNNDTWIFQYWLVGSSVRNNFRIIWNNNNSRLQLQTRTSFADFRYYTLINNPTAWVWYHIVCTWDWTTKKTYLNSVDNTTLNASWWADTDFTNMNNNQTLYLWKNNVVWTNFYMNCQLWLVKYYDRWITEDEIKNLRAEWLHKYWPTDTYENNWEFQKYSLWELEVGKVLEIDGTNIAWTFYDQSGNWNNWTWANVTVTPLWLNNVMDFNWNDSCISFTSTQLRDILQSNNWSVDLIVNPNNFNDSDWTSQRVFELAYDHNWFNSVQCFIARASASPTVAKRVFFSIFNSTVWSTIISDKVMEVWKYVRITCTFDFINNSQRLYINWILDTELTSWLVKPSNSNNIFTLWCANRSISWKIANFDWKEILPIINNRTLTATEVAKRHFSNFIKN